MNHLNLFNPFKDKANYHEDELTRAFLIVLKNVPFVQVSFIEMIRKEMVEQKCQRIIEPLSDLNSSLISISTQITQKNELFNSISGRRVVSIIISDDKLNKSTSIKHDSRNARYDGVILYDPAWVLIIENKPLVENVWLGQLNPNVNEDIEIEEKPISLSWRMVIENLSSFIEREMIYGLERTIVEDFLEFIDDEYANLNPFTSFAICKDNKYLLGKRCIAIMEQANIGEVKYHHGWKYHIATNFDSIKQIAISPDMHGDDWIILLEMYPGDTMNQARNFYSNLNMEFFLGLRNAGWELSCNMHFSFQTSNLIWTQVQLSIDDYVDYWLKNAVSLGQVSRREFDNYFKELESIGLISGSDWEAIKTKIINTNMQKINVCPGVGMNYKWSKLDAIRLDKGRAFVDDLKVKVREALDAWNCII